MQLKIKTLITYLNTGKSLDISYFYHSHHRDKTQTLIFLSGELSNFVIINVFDIILMLFFFLLIPAEADMKSSSRSLFFSV